MPRRALSFNIMRSDPISQEAGAERSCSNDVPTRPRPQISDRPCARARTWERLLTQQGLKSRTTHDFCRPRDAQRMRARHRANTATCDVMGRRRLKTTIGDGTAEATAISFAASNAQRELQVGGPRESWDNNRDREIEHWDEETCNQACRPRSPRDRDLQSRDRIKSCPGGPQMFSAALACGKTLPNCAKSPPGPSQEWV